LVQTVQNLKGIISFSCFKASWQKQEGSDSPILLLIFHKQRTRPFEEPKVWVLRRGGLGDWVSPEKLIKNVFDRILSFDKQKWPALDRHHWLLQNIVEKLIYHTSVWFGFFRYRYVLVAWVQFEPVGKNFKSFLTITLFSP
jgi:hypothetical protein